MLFTPIVEDIIAENGRGNVLVWARSPDADVNLESSAYLIRLFIKGFSSIKKGDTVFVTSTPPFLSFVVLFLRLFKRFRVIFQVQDLYPDIMKFLSWKYKLVYYAVYPFSWILYQKVDLYLTISDRIKDQLIKNYNINAAHITVVENWTDIDNTALTQVQASNRIIYIGNIGKAHDYTYFLDYILKKNCPWDIVIKTDNSSKINVFNSNELNGNGLKTHELPGFIEWNHKRYSKDELSEYLRGFDYSIVFLGKDFDRILFPCKIYSSLSMLMPVIFFGPEDSFVNQWLEKNNLGFHYSKIEENYDKINFYRENIYQYNISNPFEQKINTISKIILS